MRDLINWGYCKIKGKYEREVFQELYTKNLVDDFKYLFYSNKLTAYIDELDNIKNKYYTLAADGLYTVGGFLVMLKSINFVPVLLRDLVG